LKGAVKTLDSALIFPVADELGSVEYLVGSGVSFILSALSLTI